MTIVSANVEECFHVYVAIESAWDAVFLEIDFAGNHVGADLVGLDDRPHPVIIDLKNRVVLMIVALGAVEGQAEHGFGGVFDGFVKPRCAVELEILPSKEA